VARQTGKGRQRRQAAFERRATQHHDFVGDAEGERAEAEFRKHERLEAEGVHDGPHGHGHETPLRIPRSIDEGKRLVEEGRRLVREAPEALREKARERLGQMPGARSAISAMGVAREAVWLVLTPVRVGVAVAREVLRVPMSMIRVLRHQEA
jgi:hypothetical protein